jgi:hypothetical protein
MRLVLRLIGTWLLGLSLILFIIDGTKSLAGSAFIFTPLGETWAAIHAQSLTGMREFVTSRFFGPVLDPVIGFLLGLPGWLVLAVPGLAFAVMGRSRRVRVFVRQDQA